MRTLFNSLKSLSLLYLFHRVSGNIVSGSTYLTLNASKHTKKKGHPDLFSRPPLKDDDASRVAPSVLGNANVQCYPNVKKKKKKREKGTPVRNVWICRTRG